MSREELQLEIGDHLFTFDFAEGCAAVASGRPDGWYPGDPSEVTVKGVERYVDGTYFEVSMSEALRHFEIEEDELLEHLAMMAEEQAYGLLEEEEEESNATQD